jgi:hypothetical protein
LSGGHVKLEETESGDEEKFKFFVSTIGAARLNRLRPSPISALTTPPTGACTAIDGRVYTFTKKEWVL